MNKFTGEGLHELYAECLRLVPRGGTEFYRKCVAFDNMADKLNQDIGGNTTENVKGFNKEHFPRLFATVSKVLGDEEAEKQLSIAYESSGGVGWDNFADLSAAFAWDDTLQGRDYWGGLHVISKGGSFNV